MTNHDKGGAPSHDLRRHGTVDPREHNLQRTGGNPGRAEAVLEDANRPHKEPSRRELRRAEERERDRQSKAEPDS